MMTYSRLQTSFTECFEENLLPNGAFSKLGPQVSLFPVPIFGVNTCTIYTTIFLEKEK
jgi:hypothetical protein